MSVPSQHSYEDITGALFSCIKATSQKEHGTVYAPADADQGTATTKITWVGTVVLGFDFHPTAETLTYTIEQKPGIVHESSIWNGIQSTIDECRS